MSAQFVAMAAEAALMVLLPLVLWPWAIRRMELGRHGWATVGYGCVFFILSQIVETPFRFGLSYLGLVAPPLGGWLFALIAGLGEESMRYVAMRWVGQIRERLDRATAIAYGLGHGGFESLALGLSVLATALVLRNALADPGAMAQLPDATAAQARVIAETPPYVFFGGVVERAFAMTLHVGLSLVVMRAVLRGSLVFLGIAVGWHAIANGVALALQGWLQNGVATEAWVGLAAVAALVYGLATPEGETPAASGTS